MISVESTEQGIKAVDSSKTSIDVVTEGWTESADGPTMPRDHDLRISGRTTRLQFPPVFLVAETDEGHSFELASEVGPIELPADEYVVRVDANMLVYVAFSGPARLEKPNYEASVLSFPEPTTVTLGFRSRTQKPAETVVVPRTIEGVATALSQFPSGHRTTTADRSYPTMRDHPPRLEFGESVSIPDVVAERREETEIELRLPPDLEYLFPASSLAHYLGANVSVESGATPRIESAGRVHELPSLPSFQYETAALLRRTFLLDCLVRNAGPHGTDLAELDLLSEFALDTDALYAAPVSHRLNTYLDVPFERISDELPEWHLSMYVEPTMSHAKTLPYLLQNVPNIFLPESTPLDGGERLSRSLDDFYRGVKSSEREAVAVDLTNPKLGPGRTHGWLAGSVPIDVFKSVPEAYENRFDFLDRAGNSISVVAILNDRGMDDEYAEAARIYRERAEELDIDIKVREHLSVDELAEVFETPHDFVHYIGHCDRAGLRCPDGNLSASSLAESNAQTFFLNACGSFHEGIGLVKKGSVTGAVTFNRVVDSQAAKVGTMFARLLVHGFCFERAMQMARRRIMTGKDYAVVGDGTHVLAQSENYVSSDVELTQLDTDRFELNYDVRSPWINGGYFQTHVTSNDTSRLYGSAGTYELQREALCDFLDFANTPIVYDGDIHWSDELANVLRE
ncbi:hypothetical protein AUR64_18845 [Haloprofundus marisrubri]|uniref:CHAT domain-containing protein n=1 Tax=Haloprofundus marisrubri TaxID=1514971 RepID=A0A0W1R4S7_9EURY|nr:hypothetical protein [Haloprofundus marisrubri]KTG08298.1 hypothetical protein AUR64_18845 [Haloprofundus marisrubri]